MPRLLKGAGRTLPVSARFYAVLHLGRAELPLHAQAAWERYNLPRRKGNTGGLAGPPRVDSASYNRLLAVLDAASARLGAASNAHGDLASAEEDLRARLFFRHYSPSVRRRGYLVVDPRLALLVDTGQEDVYLLLEMAQNGHVTSDGLTAASYATLTTLLMLWDANADTQASLDDLVALDRSSRIATIGQVTQGLTLAIVSALLSVLLVTTDLCMKS